jgi:hyperosmotically inducible protein
MKTKLGPIVLGTMLVGLIAVFAIGCSKPADRTDMPVAGSTLGTEIDDSVVTSKVRSSLLADPDVKSFDFKIETRKGEVQLSGFVDNQAQLNRAIEITRAVEGVKSIDSKVSMKGAPTTIGNKVDDGVVTTQVKAALLADPRVKSLDIAVVTRRGEVQLSGFVDSQAQIDRAFELARSVEGVSHVRNDMSIKK